MADVEILRAARARIADPIHWTSRHLARNEVGRVVSPTSKEAVCWCALGALEAAGNQKRPTNIDALGEAARGLFGSCVAGVNDQRGHAAVLAVYDAAIVKAEARA